MAYKHNDKAVYIYGFTKNKRDNITIPELHQMKMFAKLMLKLEKSDLLKLVKDGTLVEIHYER